MHPTHLIGLIWIDSIHYEVANHLSNKLYQTLRKNKIQIITDIEQTCSFFDKCSNKFLTVHKGTSQFL